jgi:L-lactate dehydrogenase
VLFRSCEVRTVDAERLPEADVIVVAAGRNGKPGESRLDLLRDNARLTADLGRRLTRFAGHVVLVTNPVDVLTRVMTEASGLPASRVLGTGTMLDTARLRQTLAQRLGVSTGSIHAQVVGEHGDSEVVLWSGARVGGLAMRDWPGWQVADEPTLAQTVRRAAYEVIQRKGATNHAIGLVTANLLRALLRDERRLLTVARCQDGAAGLRDVALSLPAVVGQDGASQVFTPEMDEAERTALAHSAQVLQTAYASLQG